MSNKSIDEIASEMTIAILEHNSKLQRHNGESKSNYESATNVAKDFYVLREVVSGRFNPFREKNTESD